MKENKEVKKKTKGKGWGAVVGWLRQKRERHRRRKRKQKRKSEEKKTRERKLFRI